MECEKCQDRGFTEQEHGLIMVLCDCEAGKKKKAELGMPAFDGGYVLPPENIVLGGNEPVIPLSQMGGVEATYIGICFQLNGKRTDEYSDDGLWIMAKKEAEGKELWPHIVRMPCGNEQRFDNFLNLPVEDIPCPCGNPNHYIVRFIDNREVIDDSSSGTGRDNSNLRGENPSKPKQSRKQKKGKGTTKRTS